MRIDSPPETMQAQRRWHNIFQTLKEKTCHQLRIINLAKEKRKGQFLILFYEASITLLPISDKDTKG